MNVLVINGSPQQEGKISAILQTMVSAVQPQTHVESIQLSELTNLHHCTGCMACQQTGSCIVRDDIVLIEEAIRKSNLLVLATPTHWGNMSALMLTMFERLFGFLLEERSGGMPKIRNGLGKKVILVTACSTPWPFNWLFNQSRGCLDRLKEICRYSGLKIVGTFVLPGTIKMKEVPPKYLQKAKQFGLILDQGHN